MEKRYRRAVFIVTYRKEKNKILYLLLKRKLHWKGWEFPKGGVEPNEQLKTTAKREAQEETGQDPIKIKSYNFKGNYPYKPLLKDRPEYTGQTYQLFSAEIKNKKVKLDPKEHSTYKWLDFNNAFKTLTWPNQKVSLNIVNKSIIRK